MSAEGEDGGFLSRWSRRKLAAKARPAPAPEAAEQVPLPPDPPPPDVPPPDLPRIDLPPIETLDAASDYAVFLQKGVTAETQRLALQRAWTSDPVIAGFRGMADYDWDFNAVGYGRLSDLDDVAKLLAEVLGPEQEKEPEGEAPQPVATADSSVRLTPPAQPEPPPLVGEPDGEPAEEKPLAPRRHGSAIPTFEDDRSQSS